MSQRLDPPWPKGPIEQLIIWLAILASALFFFLAGRSCGP